MKILITGGAGFVGSNIAIYLKEKYPNYKIIALDNLSRRGSEFNLERLKNHNIEFIYGDVRNQNDLEIEFNFLIEASAEPSVLAGLDGRRKYLIDTNFNGLVNSLEVALKNKAKVIFLSTSRIYPIEKINNLQYEELDTRYKLISKERGINKEGFNEDFNFMGKNRTLYGATKLSAELIINEYINMFNLEAIINRCGVIAGKWQFGKSDQGIVPFWIMSYIFDKDLAIFGNGKQVRDILNIDDLSKLIDIQIHKFDELKNETYNIGGGIKNSISILELDLLCKNLIKNKKVNFKENRALDIKYYVTDYSKISKYWEPQKGIENTLIDIIKWVKNNEKNLKKLF